MRTEELDRWQRGDREVWSDADHEAFEAAFAALGNTLGADRSGHASQRFETHAAWDPSVLIGRFSDDGASGLEAAWRTAEDTAAELAAGDDASRHEMVESVAARVLERCWPLTAAVVAECGVNRFDAAAEIAAGVTALGASTTVESGRSVVVQAGLHDAVSGLLAGVSDGFRSGRPVILLPDRSAAFVGELVHRCVVDALGRDDLCRLVQGAPEASLLTDARVIAAATPPVGGSVMTVGEDDDLDAACETAFRAAYGFGGQRPSSLRRLELAAGAKGAFMNLFMMRVMSAITDHPWLADVDIGPTRDAATRDRIVSAAEALHP
ncbi:MAG: hypothetical protein CMJ83_11045, partial [Planctomycetes bacterium]|nr:hypothetical protein [Planctomycetota bacterium]